MQYNVNPCRFAYDQDRCRVFFPLNIFSSLWYCVGVRDQLCVYYLFPLFTWVWRIEFKSSGLRGASELASPMLC